MILFQFKLNNFRQFKISCSSLQFNGYWLILFRGFRMAFRFGKGIHSSMTPNQMLMFVFFSCYEISQIFEAVLSNHDLKSKMKVQISVIYTKTYAQLVFYFDLFHTESAHIPNYDSCGVKYESC